MQIIELLPPHKKSKMSDINESNSLDAKSLNRYSRQNAALGMSIYMNYFI